MATTSFYQSLYHVLFSQEMVITPHNLIAEQHFQALLTLFGFYYETAFGHRDLVIVPG